MTTLKQRTISGIKWTFATSMAQRVIAFATTVILARILSPADFGLFALAFVMIDGFGIFKSLGFDSALVRRKNQDIEKACNTAFFLIPAMGMILFTILYLFAPVGAKFLNNPQVTPIIRSLAVIFVISTFGKVPQTVLYRSMKFKYKSIADISAAITYSSVAVILALNKFGVWSLVVAYIAKTFVQIGIEWFFSRWKPKFEFDKALAWDMFHFGKYILASSIIWFLYSNLDNILIGKMLGVTMLGYYAISMNIATFLSQYFLGKVGMIMYPAYSQIQEDTDDVKRAMSKALRYISILVFPFSFYIFIFAPDILRIVFGAKWLPATNILRVLAFVGLFRSLGSAMWPAFLAKGKSKADFQIHLAQFFFFFALAIPLGFKFKLIGIGAAVLISTIVSFIVGLVRIKKILLINPLFVFAALKPAFLCSLVLFVIALPLKISRCTGNINLNFIIAVGISITAYFTATYLSDKHIFNDIKEALI